MEPLRRQLSNFLKKDQIIDTRLWLDIYGRDASYFDITPQAIVRPRTVEEIQHLLALCRNNRIGVTFRCGGTSLSGQTVNNGIICELRTNHRKFEVRDNGKKIWFEPGLTCDQVNAYLHPHHTHIGPDPASSVAAMMGGILGNNSSGMSAGVRHNSYHTLSSIEFVLANGHRYDSGKIADRKRFETDESDLCKGLMEIRSEIMADKAIHDKIVRKYQIKNVTGYAMNSFVDFDNPMDIFSHLLIGSEGTLGYIASGELNTLPLQSVYSSCMLYFSDVTSAASHAGWLGDSGADKVEMMDYASLRSYLGQKMDMPKGTTALLVDYGADSTAEIEDKIASLIPQLKALKGLTGMDNFTHTVAQRELLWKMRNGIFPCVAGVRVPGATVILEDVVAPVGSLDRLVGGMQALFDKHGYEGAIFGHARDGNIHPLLTSPIGNPDVLRNFRGFVDEMVDLVLKLDGSLKGEHGTGRAIAPFVAREWGDDIYQLMRRVKKLADPEGILNPGVIINDDPECFMKPMKSMTVFGDKLGYDHADKCMECGYCEHVCPSRNITFTPRQRIQALRIITEHPDDKELRKQYRYPGNYTCATDGTCQLPCPMGISTAEITDRIRVKTDPKLFDKALSSSASNYGAVENAIRAMLRAAVATEKVISPYPLIWATDFLHRLYSQVPHWSRNFPMPAKIHWQERENPEFLYFPACVTRIFGGSSLGKDDMITVVLRIADKAGMKVALPKDMHGLCCAQIWEHKGDPEGKRKIANTTVERFYELSDHGSIPIFCDTTSCTHSLLRSMEDALTAENAEKYHNLKIIDITTWLMEYVLPRVTVDKPKNRVLLHATCASKLLAVNTTLVEVAKKCAKDVYLPLNNRCCGAAGDRGFMFPEVAYSATRDEREEIKDMSFDGCYSLARTCEISMMDNIGRPYESIVYLVDETTGPAATKD